MAWEASPIKATCPPSFQGQQRIMTKDDTGYRFQSSTKWGNSGTTSGKWVSKKAFTFSPVSKAFSPSGPS